MAGEPELHRDERSAAILALMRLEARLGSMSCFDSGRTRMAKKSLTAEDQAKAAALLREIRDEIRSLRLQLESRRR